MAIFFHVHLIIIIQWSNALVGAAIYTFFLRDIGILTAMFSGKDVVAMARTGSGKTAAFLIPMFEKLKNHAAIGARALILSPTRELALQTLKFTKEVRLQVSV